MYCGEFTFGIGLSPCHRASSDPLHTTTLASTSLHSNPCAPYVHKYVWSGVRSRSRTCSLYGRLVSRCLPLASLHFHCVNIEIGLMSFCLWRGYTASPFIPISSTCLPQTDGIRIRILIRVRVCVRVNHSSGALESFSGCCPNILLFIPYIVSASICMVRMSL